MIWLLIDNINKYDFKLDVEEKVKIESVDSLILNRLIQNAKQFDCLSAYISSRCNDCRLRNMCMDNKYISHMKCIFRWV